MRTKLFTEADCEAAMCLWEAMLVEYREEGKPGHEWAEPMHARWDQWGTSEMRHDCIALAPIAERVWQIVRETGEEDHLVPFDWEFIPAFLRRVQWISPPSGEGWTPIDEAAMAADLLKIVVPS
ncbi:hypothetical protein [Mesorhizobium sp. M0243]|uniref:hypothetical protein n=1 Tax=Mesorhizobium sp. M0243 TaxID=2956925 RepID=UPI00333A930E